MTQINSQDGRTDPFGLPRNSANHASLTPLDFLFRTARVYPDATSVIHIQGVRSLLYTVGRFL